MIRAKQLADSNPDNHDYHFFLTKVAFDLIKNNSSENSSEFITNEENPKEYFDSRNVRNLQESYTTTKAE